MEQCCLSQPTWERAVPAIPCLAPGRAVHSHPGMPHSAAACLARRPHPPSLSLLTSTGFGTQPLLRPWVGVDTQAAALARPWRAPWSRSSVGCSAGSLQAAHPLPRMGRRRRFKTGGCWPSQRVDARATFGSRSHNDSLGVLTWVLRGSHVDRKGRRDWGCVWEEALQQSVPPQGEPARLPDAASLCLERDVQVLPGGVHGFTGSATDALSLRIWELPCHACSPQFSPPAQPLPFSEHLLGSTGSLRDEGTPLRTAAISSTVTLLSPAKDLTRASLSHGTRNPS